MRFLTVCLGLSNARPAGTVNQADDPPQGRWRWGALHFRWESGLEQCEPLLDEGTQGLAGFRPAQETEDAEHKDVGQTIPFRLFPAGVGHATQHFYERVIHRCNLSKVASLWHMVMPKTRFSCHHALCRVRIYPVFHSVNLVSNDPAPATKPFRAESEGRNRKDRPEWDINPPTGFTRPTLATGS